MSGLRPIGYCLKLNASITNPHPIAPPRESGTRPTSLP